MMMVPHSSRSVPTTLEACFTSVVAHRLSPTSLIPSIPTALCLSFCLRLRKIPGTCLSLLHLPESANRGFFFVFRCLCSFFQISESEPSHLEAIFQFPLVGSFLLLLLLFSLSVLDMESWRKQHGEGHHQVGHWSGSSSFYNRKPPLKIWQPTVPRWEKMFCSTVGLVPWGKLVETKKYMHLHGNVMNWDDSAGREAFQDAKSRFWAVMNGLPCNVSLPDPNIYIEDIKWNSSVDPELILDLERDATVPNEEEKDEEVVILGDPFLLNQPFFYSGWGEAEADAPKHIDSCSGALENLHENTREGPWEQHHAPDEAAKIYEWKNCRNGSWGWNQWEHHH